MNELVGKHVTLWCGVYIYSGVLKEVNDKHVVLDKAHLVYETGKLDTPLFHDAQKLPGIWYVKTDAIESFGQWPVE